MLIQYKNKLLKWKIIEKKYFSILKNSQYICDYLYFYHNKEENRKKENFCQIRILIISL